MEVELIPPGRQFYTEITVIDQLQFCGFAIDLQRPATLIGYGQANHPRLSQAYIGTKAIVTKSEIVAETTPLIIISVNPILIVLPIVRNVPTQQIIVIMALQK